MTTAVVAVSSSLRFYDPTTGQFLGLSDSLCKCTI